MKDQTGDSMFGFELECGDAPVSPRSLGMAVDTFQKLLAAAEASDWKVRFLSGPGIRLEARPDPEAEGGAIVRAERALDLIVGVVSARLEDIEAAVAMPEVLSSLRNLIRETGAVVVLDTAVSAGMLQGQEASGPSDASDAAQQDSDAAADDSSRLALPDAVGPVRFRRSYCTAETLSRVDCLLDFNTVRSFGHVRGVVDKVILQRTHRTLGLVDQVTESRVNVRFGPLLDRRVVELHVGTLVDVAGFIRSRRGRLLHVEALEVSSAEQGDGRRAYAGDLEDLLDPGFMGGAGPVESVRRVRGACRIHDGLKTGGA